MEKQNDYEEQKDCDDHESEEEQHPTIFFTQKQLEVLLKINRPDFIGLMEAIKRRTSKSIVFKLAKLGNFDEVQD
jgi:hypothetical protein